jgi:hypothetical protein
VRVVFAAIAAIAGGFDHQHHARDLEVDNIAAIACTRCHDTRGGKIAAPGHAACFGGCHGAMPATPPRGTKLALPPERLRVCVACHAETQLVAPFTGKLAVPYPPYAIDPDFAVSIGHKKHRAVACARCHAAPDGKPPARPAAPHARCAGCHDGGAGRGGAMTECATCHVPATGKPQPPHLAVARDTVTATVSHARHAARGAAGRDCVTCHATIADTDDVDLPRPVQTSCAIAGCHDGKAAFATTARCTACHAAVPERFEVERPTARFSHAGHKDALAKTPCASCHPTTPHGEVAVAGHAACAACHAADFGKRRPTICGACHVATEPWRPLAADRPPPERGEFGAAIDHGKHGSDCARCHSLRTPSAQLRTPRGHRACTGATCHARGGGPAPTLDACTTCHVLGLVASREAARVADPWSVRARFEHRVHTGPCTSCHAALGADVATLATPPKSACAPCHDGAIAFKLTGTTCTRCHVGKRP